METETKTQTLIRETISALRREAQTKFDQIGLPRYAYSTREVKR